MSVTSSESLADIENVRLPNADRNEIRLGDLWANQPVVFVWLRHYG